LVSIGSIQSNPTRQVAAVAAKLGMKARLVQESWVDSANDHMGNILLSRIMGAHVELAGFGFGIGFKESWENALEDVRSHGGIPYAIPAGASDHRLGGLGFAHWAREVSESSGYQPSPRFSSTMTASAHWQRRCTDCWRCRAPPTLSYWTQSGAAGTGEHSRWS